MTTCQEENIINQETQKGYAMQAVQIGEFKANFSQILDEIKTKGEEYILEFGKNHEKVAVLIPYEKYRVHHSQKINLGLLQGKASFAMSEDFAITDEELLGS